MFTDRVVTVLSISGNTVESLSWPATSCILNLKRHLVETAGVSSRFQIKLLTDTIELADDVVLNTLSEPVNLTLVKQSPLTDAESISKLGNKIINGEPAAVLQLLKMPVVVDQKIRLKYDGNSFLDYPLVHAVRRGHVEIAQLLLEAGSDKDADSPLACPLMVAACKGHVGMLSLLCQAGASKHPSILLAAAKRGRDSAVQYLLQQGMDPDAHVNGQTALALAVAGDHVSTVRALVDANADLTTNTFQKKLLLLALQSEGFERDVGVANVLQKAGAPRLTCCESVGLLLRRRDYNSMLSSTEHAGVGLVLLLVLLGLYVGLRYQMHAMRIICGLVPVILGVFWYKVWDGLCDSEGEDELGIGVAIGFLCCVGGSCFLCCVGVGVVLLWLLFGPQVPLEVLLCLSGVFLLIWFLWFLNPCFEGRNAQFTCSILRSCCLPTLCVKPFLFTQVRSTHVAPGEVPLLLA